VALHEAGPEVADLEADLAVARDRVTMSVRALGDELARRRDWRSWVRAHPTLTLGAAAALGFLAGRGPRSSSSTKAQRRWP
jgi:hypothetical protein